MSLAVDSSYFGQGRVVNKFNALAESRATIRLAGLLAHDGDTRMSIDRARLCSKHSGVYENGEAFLSREIFYAFGIR